MDFTFLSKYVFNEVDETASKAKHSFYKLNPNDVPDAEKRLNYKFPNELKSFYNQIGYGFMCNQNEDFFDRFMDPSSVADFVLCEGMYECNENGELYESNFLTFFEVSEVSFIALDLNNVNSEGEAPIYYLNYKIADTLKEFLYKMDENPDYYMQYGVDAE